MAEIVDLLIVAGDLAFGPDGEPLLIGGAGAIAQDVQHRVRESGLAPLLVAEDGPAAESIGRLAQLVEEDLRIRPGTARIAGPDASGLVIVTARTIAGPEIAIEAES